MAKNLLNRGVFADHVIHSVAVPDGAVEMIDQRQIGKGGQSPDDTGVFIFERHVIGPHGNGLILTGVDFPRVAEARLAIGNCLRKQLGIGGGFRAEYQIP